LNFRYLLNLSPSTSAPQTSTLKHQLTTINKKSGALSFLSLFVYLGGNPPIFREGRFATKTDICNEMLHRRGIAN
jgi:hypothetical protein